MFFNNPHKILEQCSLVYSFLDFVQIDTQSDPNSATTPSTQKQFDLQKLLEKKLEALGCVDIKLDDKAYLYATFPGNAPKAKVIGLMAHVDTAPDFCGTDVKPIVHNSYNGSPIILPEKDVVIDPSENEELEKCIRDSIITASGDTLLGADDKAGIAVILSALEILGNDDSISRPTLRIAFTPDEEIGRGALDFDVEGFGAYCAYTLDGGFAGEVNFETFSADKAEVTFTGVAVHPGFAKGKLVNALRYLGKFLDVLPNEESPESTEGRQGFFHPVNVKGNASEASAELILRDFDDDILAERGARLRQLASDIATSEPRLKTEVKITRQYRNMAGVLSEHPKVRDFLLQAVADAGIQPNDNPVRGGTDGSGLSAKGLPTPNIFAGGINFHGPREWISTRVMAQSVCTVLNLVQRWAEDGQ
jgi:tripeptide aminopeptidase